VGRMFKLIPTISPSRFVVGVIIFYLILAVNLCGFIGKVLERVFMTPNPMSVGSGPKKKTTQESVG
jgi:hypothetical protein